jgi:hypothetical protein
MPVTKKRVVLTEQRLAAALDNLDACGPKSKQFLHLFKKHGFNKAYQIVTAAAFAVYHSKHVIGDTYWGGSDVANIIARAMNFWFYLGHQDDRRKAERNWAKVGRAQDTATTFRTAFPAARVKRLLLDTLRKS